MSLQSTAAAALLALALGWPRTESTPEGSRVTLSQFVSRDDVAQLEAIAAAVAHKRGYALADQLDDIAISKTYQEIITGILSQFSHDPGILSRAFSELKINDFLSPVTDLQPLAARTAAAIAAVVDLASEDFFTGLIVESDKALEDGETLPDLLRDRSIPAELRHYFRLSLRGGVALACLPFVDQHNDVRRELFRHAAIGMENNLRLVAAFSKDQLRANDLLRDLDLEPLDLEMYRRRGDQLAAARKSLAEARSYVPNFELPPHPSFKSDK